jgi:3'-phosphoadenosine 5'-phosphosulfate sulfotransferase
LKDCGPRFFVFEADNGLVGNSKAIVNVALEGYFALLHVKSRAADTRVDGFVVGILRGACIMAARSLRLHWQGLDVSSDEELVESFTV